MAEWQVAVMAVSTVVRRRRKCVEQTVGRPWGNRTGDSIVSRTQPNNSVVESCRGKLFVSDLQIEKCPIESTQVWWQCSSWLNSQCAM